MTSPVPITFEPIGVVRSALVDKVSAPRQPFLEPLGEGRIELTPGRHFEDALADLETWSHLWVLFVFDRNPTWHPKVLPPHGSDRRRGVFATRSPHRPNPIGMSVVRLVRVDGLTVHVAGLDILDGTPVLDLKPYVPAADVIATASAGWLEAPAEAAAYRLTWSTLVEAQLAWLATHGEPADGDLRPRIARALARGPEPHAFRRIRKGPDGSVLGLPGWRVHFHVDDRVVHVVALRSAHPPAHLAHDPSLHVHRAFIEAFP
jgi:tRNA-Thr(GGU) m(6)t(6)A37 methyltransferase TsaA